jgi:hypothetical protein
MLLDKSELFIAFVFENFCKKRGIVLFSDECLDSIYQGGRPLNYEVFEAVLLVQVSIHELLHSLPWHFILLAFLVKLDFLRIHIGYGILKLFQR